MSTAVLLRPIRLLLVAILALGLGLSSFAHRMLADPDQLAFALATGATSADLCGDAPADTGSHPPCLACQIVGALLPPALPGLPVDLRLAHGDPVLPAAPGPGPGASHNKAHPAQGPPAA
jgi:hypothetical protein